MFRNSTNFNNARGHVQQMRSDSRWSLKHPKTKWLDFGFFGLCWIPVSCISMPAFDTRGSWSPRKRHRGARDLNLDIIKLSQSDIMTSWCLYVSRSKHHNARSHTSTKEPKIHIGGATDSAKAEIATESRVTESNMDKIHENSSELLKCVVQNLAVLILFGICLNIVWVVLQGSWPLLALRPLEVLAASIQVFEAGLIGPLRDTVVGHLDETRWNRNGFCKTFSILNYNLCLHVSMF